MKKMLCKIKFCEYITFLHFFAKRYLKHFKFFFIFTFYISYIALVGNFNRIYILLNLTIILYIILFYLSSRKFSWLAIFPGPVMCFFLMAFWAAGGKITFLREVNFNLKPPLNAH
jgi:hypothetical protein